TSTINPSYPHYYNQIAINPSITTSYTITGSANGGCVFPPNVISIFFFSPPTPGFFFFQNVFFHTLGAFPVFSSNIQYAYWYWGDGNVTSSLYPTHTYSIAGTYNICVHAYFNNGCDLTYCLSDSLYRLSGNSPLSNMVYVNVINGATAIEQNR